MKKELLKGFTMLALIIALALATAVASANAQSSKKVVANIPFEFIASGVAMPAGEYSLRVTAASDNGLLIQSTDTKISAMRLTFPIAPKNHRSEARLVFHRYGQRYFLTEVWTAEDSTGRQLLKSRQERAIERELARITSKSELAQNRYEVVELVAMPR
jgi:hypothetical protein